MCQVRCVSPEEAVNKITVRGYENNWGNPVVVLETAAEISTKTEGKKRVLHGCIRQACGSPKGVVRSKGVARYGVKINNPLKRRTESRSSFGAIRHLNYLGGPFAV